MSEDRELPLAGRTALVTGSSRGIGRAIGVLLAARGARVAIHGRDASAVEHVREEIARSGGEAVGITADLTSPAECKRLRDTVEGRLGAIDILVANAGGNAAPPGPIEDLDLAEWAAVLDANLTATFLTVSSILPGMKQRGAGAIVTVSSAASRKPTAYTPVAYAAAKSGIETLTRLIALQAGPFGVRANCVAPGTILTERTSVQIPAEMQTRLAADHPLGRLGTPDDVANAVLHLVGPDSAWVSGIVMDVAGGSVLA